MEGISSRDRVDMLLIKAKPLEEKWGLNPSFVISQNVLSFAFGIKNQDFTL